jgi:ribosomal protein L23
MPRVVPAGPKIFFPNLVFRLIRSPPGYAPNEAVFRVPPKVNKLDITTYLERLYGLTVENVRTSNYNEKVKYKEIKRSAKPTIRPEKRGMGLRPLRVAAYKRAIVTLSEDFRWPEPPDADKSDSATVMQDFMKNAREEQMVEKMKRDAEKREEEAQRRLEETAEETARLLSELQIQEPPKTRVRGGNVPKAGQTVASDQPRSA